MTRSHVVATLGALALTAATLSAQATTAKPKEAWASGQILRVDQIARSVVLKQGTHEMTFALAMDAHLMQGKKTLQTSDLSSEVGRQVKVRYTTSGDRKTADRIEVAEAMPAPAKVAAKATAKK